MIGDIKTNSFHVQARFDRGTVSDINIYIVDNLYTVKRNGKTILRFMSTFNRNYILCLSRRQCRVVDEQWENTRRTERVGRY